MKTLIYLAVPYSHPVPEVREARFQAVNEAAAKLMRQGFHIFSPISHTHPIAEAGDLPKGWDFWKAYDLVILEACREVMVLMLPGWRESKGVTGELEMAKEMGLPVTFLRPCDIIPHSASLRLCVLKDGKAEA